MFQNANGMELYSGISHRHSGPRSSSLPSLNELMDHSDHCTESVRSLFGAMLEIVGYNEPVNDNNIHHA